MALSTRPTYLTIQEVSDWLKVPVKTLADWRLKKINLPFVPMSDRVIRYDEAAVLRYMDSKTVSVNEETPGGAGVQDKKVR